MMTNDCEGVKCASSIDHYGKLICLIRSLLITINFFYNEILLPCLNSSYLLEPSHSIANTDANLRMYNNLDQAIELK